MLEPKVSHYIYNNITLCCDKKILKHIRAYLNIKIVIRRSQSHEKNNESLKRKYNNHHYNLLRKNIRKTFERTLK